MIDKQPITWRKSSRSDHQGGQCIEVAALVPMVAMRDSKDPDGPRLILAPTEWRSLAQRIQAR
ncbi:hypothetical protein FHU30_009087 [Actinomadura rupiterrae]|nr:hypothetical protein [Actinomadura rupiterrae]